MAPSSPASTRAGRRLRRAALLTLGAFAAVTVLPVLVFRFLDPPTSAFMLARRYEAWDKGEKDFHLRQTWVPLGKLGPLVPRAVIASEDQNFATHFGFDPEAIEDALEDRREGKSHRGASTLSQQVAKNLFLWKNRSWVRKGLEAYFTLLLELLWNKHRILEMHLNIAELGNGVYGVEAASRQWFKKGAAELDVDEAAALASILPSPRTRRPDALTDQGAERARWIVDQMDHLSVEVQHLVPMHR